MSTPAPAILLDNGNLVVRDQLNISMVFWQSFDNPVGTLLPGGWLGFNRITDKNISLISGPSFGLYFEQSILEINTKQNRVSMVRHISNTYDTTTPIKTILMLFPAGWAFVKMETLF
uniref:non-specific serine/threonine protein kinase n=1 Tax=Triticum urartu TaxID=4572 RepID=A0A8R7UGF5_TRIUA